MYKWENLDDFLSTDDYGVIAFLRKNGGTGAPKEVTVIFDDPYHDVELGDDSFEITNPSAMGKTVDLVGARRGDTLEISGEIYDIISDQRPDGTGMSTLKLAYPE